MEKKYPLTAGTDVNKALEKQLQRTNNLDDLANDFLYSNKIIFKYRENGNYNDIIMTAINKLMQVVDSPIESFNARQTNRADKQGVTNYQDF